MQLWSDGSVIMQKIVGELSVIVVDWVNEWWYIGFDKIEMVCVLDVMVNGKIYCVYCDDFNGLVKFVIELQIYMQCVVFCC